MVKGDLTPRIPNPHRGDIGKDLLGRVLEQANISKEEWRRLYSAHWKSRPTARYFDTAAGSQVRNGTYTP